MAHFRRTHVYSLSLSLPLSRKLESATMPPRIGLSRPTRLEVWALQKLTSLETYCHAWMRRETFPRYLFAVSLLPMSVLASSTGLLLSRTITLVEANEVCEQRLTILMAILSSSYREEFLEGNSVSKLIPGRCAHHMYTITSPSLNLSTLSPPPTPSLCPQSNPDIMGAAGRGVDRSADLALLQSPSACGRSRGFGPKT